MSVRIPSAVAKTTPSLSGPKALKSVSFVAGAMMLGDLGCQAMESVNAQTPFVLDHLRTLRMGITGAFVLTPMSLSWNMFAERLAPGTSWRAILIKMGVSVAVLPPMLASQFTSLTLLEEGKTMDDVRRKLSQDFLPTLKNGMCYWPLVGMLNSAFVPVLSRPAMSSFAGVFWNVYISYQANHNGMEVGELSVVYPLTEAESARAALRSEAGTKFASDGGGGVVSESTKGDVDVKGKESSGEERASTGDGRSSVKKSNLVRRTTVVSM